jgi:hypothetical protein
MDREKEEMILRLTARHVLEYRTGQQPQLSEYISRYPHYADMIADFVTFYHAIDAATIPQELCHRLSKALHQPLAAIEMYLRLGKQKQATLGVAESSSNYHIEDRSVLDVHVLGFQETVEQSKHMTGEQKGVWHTILAYEGLL